MKALTLHQPWATLIAIGAKRVETRSFGMSYRGSLAIHAGKTIPEYGALACFEEPFASTLKRAGINKTSDLPTGCVVAVANLQDVVRVENVMGWITADERDFGNYEPGRFAWVLSPGVRRLETPVHVRGMQGLWTLPPLTEDMVNEQLEGTRV